MAGCTKQQITELGLDPYVTFTPAMSYKEALLAEAFTRGFTTPKKIKDKMDDFLRAEEEIVQKAIAKSEMHTLTTWQNKRYGEIELRLGKRYTVSDLECREYVFTWHITALGITPERENGKACKNPDTGRFEWVKG